MYGAHSYRLFIPPNLVLEQDHVLRSDPLLVFVAVKQMGPSSREAIGPEVPDECPFSAPSPRGAMVQKFQMHAYSVVSPGVCKCATNEVVQFFVYKEYTFQ